MPVERSAGAVIFYKNQSGTIEYLLLHHRPSQNGHAGKPPNGHWSFPKGHLEKNEKTEDAVRREVKEETGLEKIEFIPGFKETIRYFVNFYGEKRLKFVAFFLARVSDKSVKISEEHQEYAWLTFEEAYRLITHSGDKEVIRKANDFLSEKSL